MTHQGVHDLFSQAAHQFASDVALDRGSRRITYAELETRSNRLASALLRGGASNGALVAILAEDPIEVTTAILGILKAGGVFVPLDPGFPAKRLQAMTAQVRPEWYVVEPRYFRKPAELGAPDGASIIGFDQLAGEEATRPSVESSGDSRVRSTSLRARRAVPRPFWGG